MSEILIIKLSMYAFLTTAIADVAKYLWPVITEQTKSSLVYGFYSVCKVQTKIYN